MFSALHPIKSPLYTITFHAICFKYILILSLNLFSPFVTSCERCTSLSEVRNRERIKRYGGGGGLQGTHFEKKWARFLPCQCVISPQTTRYLILTFSVRFLLCLKRQTKPASQPFSVRPWFESLSRGSHPPCRYVDWWTRLERAFTSVSALFTFYQPLKLICMCGSQRLVFVSSSMF